MVCSLTNTIMIDPVSLACGHEFSRRGITNYIEDYNSCPKCHKKANIHDIRSAQGLKERI